MPTWASTTMVTARYNMVATALTTGQIQEWIEEAESCWTAKMKSYGHFGIGGGTFTATKHGVLRRLAVAYAVLCAVTSSSLCFNTLSDASFVADWAATEYFECRELLLDKSVVDTMLENE